MSVTPEDLAKLQSLRQRVLSGVLVSRDELREGIEIARKWRSQPSPAKVAKTKAAKAPALSMDDLNAMFAKIANKTPTP